MKEKKCTHTDRSISGNKNAYYKQRYDVVHGSMFNTLGTSANTGWI